MKNLLLLTVFILSVSAASASNNPITTISNQNLETVTNVTTELAISTKGIKTLEEIEVLDFHKNTYLKLMLKAKKVKKIC